MTMIELLAVVLLCLPFLIPTASFASAHTTHDAKVNAAPGKVLTGKALRDEIVTHRKCDHSRDPLGPLHRTDRYRAADSVPSASERPLPGADQASADEPVARVASHHHGARSRTAHTPAALQVFRC
ncbi:hypothetical protein [Streptomyces bluensis]|uniref:hypothetical protein n=1 Tax=Streptomyces bluensis TaxID=33897 RepID=UPI003317DA28